MLDEGYGIMPNKVLFDNSISSTSKLVYILISSLCAAEGKCWASNTYLGEKLGMSERQVSRSIKVLEKYLSIDNPYNEKRVIRLDKNVYLPRQKRRSGLDKNVQHNNTSEYYKYNKGRAVEKYQTPSAVIERMYSFRPTELPR